MSEFTAKSGAKIIINDADWKDAKALKMVLQNEISKLDLKGIDLKTDAAVLIGMVMRVDSSPALDAALWPCLARSTREGSKITESLFQDDLKARADYYEIMLECITVNMRPFVASLFSLLPPVMVEMAKAAMAVMAPIGQKS